jgi:transposase
LGEIMILRPDSPMQMMFISRDEALGDEALVRVIGEVVGALDLGELYSRYSEAGRGFYDPAMMIRVLFFAYCEGETASREIAKKIRYDIRYQYFAGSLRPDFRTVNRFRLDNLDLLGGYFARIVAICQEAGLVDLSLVALDGTKMRASASRRRTLGRKELAKLAKEFEGRLRQDAEREDEETEQFSKQSQAVSWNGEFRKRLKEAIGRLTEGEQEKVNLTDPDAKFMKTSEGSIRPCYNSQVAVDKNQIILSADVSDNAKDSPNFEPLIEQVQRTVEGDMGRVVADGGYYSAGNLKYATEAGLDIYIPVTNAAVPQEDGFEREAFTYDESSDGYRCPAGNVLFYKYSLNEKGVIVKIYGASIRQCRACSLKPKCTKTRFRKLRIPEVYNQVLEMRRKLSSPEGRRIYERRKAMVEPVFGNMKFNLGFGRFHLRTLAKVKGEFFLMCIAHNLKKLCNHWEKSLPLAICKKILAHFMIIHDRLGSIIEEMGDAGRLTPIKCKYT